MKQLVNAYLLFAVVTIAFTGCAGQMAANSGLKLDVNVTKSYAWINLMPGSRPSFHFSGELTVRNEDSSEVKNLFIREVEISDDYGLKLLRFQPIYSVLNNNTADIKPGEAAGFSITAPKDLNIAKLKDIDFITIVVKFSSMGRIFEYTIDKAKIDKVY